MPPPTHLLLLILTTTLLTTITTTSSAAAAAPTLADRVSRLNELARKQTVIRLKDSTYRDLVKAQPRNYSVILMMTALSSRRQCAICRQAADEFEVVASSWRISAMYSTEPSRLYFALADYDDAADVFQQLQLNSAPSFMHFPPSTQKRKDQDNLNIQMQGFEAEEIAKWVQERTGAQIRVMRRPNYIGVALLTALLCFCAAVVYLRRSSFEFLFSRQLYAVLSIFLVLFFTSGQMWNHMRGPPLMSRHPQSGQLVYIHGSTQGQFVIETYIVMAVQLCTVIGFILLIEAAKMPASAAASTGGGGDQASASTKASGSKRVMAIGGLVLVAVFFSVLLSIFRAKLQGYPYSFLLR